MGNDQLIQSKLLLSNFQICLLVPQDYQQIYNQIYHLILVHVLFFIDETIL